MELPVTIDLHMHSTTSDGTDTPEEILMQVKKAGIDLFSLTDHDAIKGCAVILDHLKEGDPRFIPGIEFSCRDEKGKYHILGYAYDISSSAINSIVEQGHAYRMIKLQKRLAFLKNTFGFDPTLEEINTLLSMDNPGKPHIADLMIKYGFASTKREAMHRYINQLQIKNENLRPKEAIEGILAAGGIPVLAHPSYGDGDQLILGDEMEQRLRRLMSFGLQGVEAYYSGFTDKLRQEILSLADKYKLYVTAGSDYHGTNKLVALCDTGLENASNGVAGLKEFLNRIL